MNQKRLDPETGREQIWVKPDGLSGLWVTRGYCERCETYRECLGLLSLTDKEWKELENLISEANDPAAVKEQIEGMNLACARPEWQ
jgi:hypothetical protein